MIEIFEVVLILDEIFDVVNYLLTAYALNNIIGELYKLKRLILIVSDSLGDFVSREPNDARRAMNFSRSISIVILPVLSLLISEKNLHFDGSPSRFCTRFLCTVVFNCFFFDRIAN